MKLILSTISIFIVLFSAIVSAQIFTAQSLCESDEIAIGATVECRQLGTQTAQGAVLQSSTSLPGGKGWEVTCTGDGVALVQALCAPRSSLSYRVATSGTVPSTAGIRTPSTNPGRYDNSYFAESNCNTNEIAIGGQARCIPAGNNAIVMTVSNGIQRIGTSTGYGYYELQGWMAGCAGEGKAEVEAFCVPKETTILHHIFEQKQQYTPEVYEPYSAIASCGSGEIALGGQGGCNEAGSTGYENRPPLSGYGGLGSTAPFTNWQFTCRGMGSAVVEANCINTPGISYTLGTQGCSGCMTADNRCVPFAYRENGYYCGLDNQFAAQKEKTQTCKNDFECVSNSCPEKYNMCLDPCEGCYDTENNYACLTVGTRKETTFCSLEGDVLEQLPVDSSCSNNFECSTNLCKGEVCVEPGFFNAFLRWLKSLGKK